MPFFSRTPLPALLFEPPAEQNLFSSLPKWPHQPIQIFVLWAARLHSPAKIRNQTKRQRREGRIRRGRRWNPLGGRISLLCSPWRIKSRSKRTLLQYGLSFNGESDNSWPRGNQSEAVRVANDAAVFPICCLRTRDGCATS